MASVGGLKEKATSATGNADVARSAMSEHVYRGASAAAQWLAAPVPVCSLAIFRIVFGLMMTWWTLDYLRTDRVRLLCSPATFHFTYYGFDWIQPWPGNGMVLQFMVMLLASLLIALGAFYRPAALIFALGFTHFFLLDRTNYQNHYYLIMLLSWIMVLLPANRAFSVDVLNGSIVSSSTIPRWCLLLVQFHIAVPYFYGGLAKIETDWLSSDPMRYMLTSKTSFPVIGPWLGTNYAALALTWGGLLFDLLIVPALLWSRTRTIAYCAAVAFHVTNSVLFNIHVFPWLMIAATTILFPPDWPRSLSRCFKTVSRKAPAVDSSPAGPAASALPLTKAEVFRQIPERIFELRGLPAETEHRPQPIVLSKKQLYGLAVLNIYCLFHLIWPLRHHLYEGNSGWTERGHYFSWRMMLRGKTSGIRYYITDPESGDTWNADIRRYLHAEQQEKFARDPEMILDLAHFLADQYQTQSGRRVEVRALVLSSMNGRKPQLLIDPQVDLAAEPRGWHHRDWIVPLTEPLRDEPWTIPLNEWEQHVELPDLPFLKQDK